jgi:hypothetical protein
VNESPSPHGQLSRLVFNSPTQRKVASTALGRLKAKRKMTGTPRRPWTPERDKELRELVFSASSAETIAKALNRTTFAVRHRARTLRLPLRKIAKRRS